MFLVAFIETSLRLLLVLLPPSFPLSLHGDMKLLPFDAGIGASEAPRGAGFDSVQFRISL